ncbi:MAG: hypothetical protein ABEJ28_01070 [Salinigranum sp.]
MGDADRGSDEPDVAADSDAAIAPDGEARGEPRRVGETGPLSAPDVGDQEILSVFVEAADEEPLRPRDVAETLPIPIEVASDRLDDLRERGFLVRDDDYPGQAVRLAPGAEDALAISDDRVVTGVEAQASKTTSPATPPHDSETPTTPPPDPMADPSGRTYHPPEDAIEAFDPPGDPEQKERRRDALRRACAYLADRGRADREDFVADVFPEAPGAYERADDGWWRRVIRPGLAQLPGVEAPESRGGEWRFAAAEVDDDTRDDGTRE